MVLNPNRIEPTFLKLDSWLPGAGFVPIITSNVLNQIKEKRIQEKKSVLCIQKTFNAVFKSWFNPVWGSIPRLLILYKSLNVCLHKVSIKGKLYQNKIG